MKDKNTKYILWGILFMIGYIVIGYSLGSRWGWMNGVLTTVLLYMIWKPWLISPFEGKFTRQKTKSEELKEWFDHIRDEQRKK